MYEERFYREFISDEERASFVIHHQETDMLITIDQTDLTQELMDYAYNSVKKLREIVDQYIAEDPIFATSFVPHTVNVHAPDIIKKMAMAGKIANVGPMASVAGAFAEHIGMLLCKCFNLHYIIVENGGDIYVTGDRDIYVGLYAGKDSIYSRLKFKICKENLPAGICSSSGKFGHSISLGYADCVTVICQDAALADAYATCICNKIRIEKDIESVLNEFMQYEDINGMIIMCDYKIGMYGAVNLQLI